MSSAFEHRYYCKMCARDGDRVESLSRDEIVEHIRESHPDARVPTAMGVSVEKT